MAARMQALFAEYKKRQLRDSGETYLVQLSQISRADVA